MCLTCSHTAYSKGAFRLNLKQYCGSFELDLVGCYRLACWAALRHTVHKGKTRAVQRANDAFALEPPVAQL